MTASTTASVESSVERFFECSLYLLIVAGFATLAATGKLDLLSVSVVTGALGVRGYLLWQRRSFIISERGTSLFTLAYVAFYALDYFLISDSFVTATVHLVLFSMVVKIFSVRRDRDHLYLALLAFLMVLAASVLTVDTVFLAAFAVFLVLAMATFISFEMKRSFAASVNRAREAAVPMKRFGLTLSGVAAMMLFTTLLGSAVIFFILPRLSAGYLSAFAPQNQLVSGFSDNVQLGQIGEIKLSNQVVMHVSVLGDNSGTRDLRLRGVSLADFDGMRWYNPGQRSVVPDGFAGRFDLTRVQPAWRTALGIGTQREHRVINYRVLMEPVGTNVVFVAPAPMFLAGNFREITVDSGGGIYNIDHDRLINSYEATSDIARPSENELRQAYGEPPNDISLLYRQLPALDRRVPQLAHEVTLGASTDYDRAVAIEEYLRTHYRYTLQQTQRPRRDAIAYFLFDRKQGHCEYFASTMAVMLRTLGIPSRLVNGFHGGEFNPITGSYIIRARDAHSWVEAYFPNIGWVSFDPTPADAVDAPSTFSRLMLYIDAGREFWREWIINYDFSHQHTVATAAAVQSRRTVLNFRDWWHREYEALLARARRTRDNAIRQPDRWTHRAILVLILVLLTANAPRIWRAMCQRSMASNPGRAPQTAASIWYKRMERLLARRGWRRLPSHTAAEFVAGIEDPALRIAVERFTTHYERARFGDSAQDAERLPELYQELKSR